MTVVAANNYFAARHAGHRSASDVVPRLAAVYQWFHGAGLCEPKFEAEIRKGSYSTYAQDVSEMLVAYRLHQHGFGLKRSPKSGGPDFIAEKEGVSVQIEIVTPQALPTVGAFLARPKEGVFNVPLKDFLLCWTKGIAQKASQLLGDGQIRGWKAKGTVDDSLPFVVVVNGCMFATALSEGFRPPMGGFPWAAVGVYAISDLKVYLDPTTAKRVGSGYEFRKELERPGRGAVPLDTFHDEKFKPISAIWAVSLDDFDLLHDPIQVLPRQAYESALLHNPMAHVPMPQGLLPVFEEWAVQQSTSSYTLERVVNNLPPEHV